MKKNPLGRGLESLIPGASTTAQKPSPVGVQEIDITSIIPNDNQPRRVFDQDALNELVESIRQRGIIQPLVVTRTGEKYMLIAGERRWRAAGLAGLRNVPVVVRKTDSERERLELAIIENIQRENLNALELAEAYKNLIDKHGYRQDDVATVMGKSRSSVANTLRILSLPDAARESLSEGAITEGHARALLMLDTTEQMLTLLTEIIRKRLSVRDAENRARAMLKTPAEKKERTLDLFTETLQKEFEDYFRTKVAIRPKKRGGTIEIAYSDAENLEGIIKIIRGEV